MVRLSTLTGILLIVVGLIGFFATGAEHMTALIPAALGVLFVICGVMGMKPGMRKHAMHAAAALALVGLLGTVRGLMALIQWLIGGATPERQAAVVAQGVTAVICLLFLALAIRSFITARRNQA